MISENTHRGSSLILAIKEWLPARTETIRVLRNEADSIVSHRWTTTYLAVGTVGVGLALAPFTFGASLAVATGGAMAVGTQVAVSHYLEGRNYADSQQKMEADKFLCNTVKVRLESVVNFCEDICKTFTAFDMHEAFELVLVAHTQVEDRGTIASATQFHFDRKMLDNLLVDQLPNDLQAWISNLLEVIGKTKTVIEIRDLADKLEEEKKRFERIENLPYETAPTAIEQATSIEPANY